MEVRLDGRSAIITGASMGLGLAMAKEFAASGGDVAILARRPEVLEQAKQTVTATAKGGRVATFICDVSKADDIQKTYDGVVKAFGKVDILINNAGQSRAMPTEQITDDIWHDDLELKLFAAIRLTRLVWPGMKQRKWGRIINVLNTGAKAPRANGAPDGRVARRRHAVTRCVRRALARQHLHERHAGGARHRGRCPVRPRRLRAGVQHVDDAAPFALLHPRPDQAREADRGEQLQVEVVLPDLVGDLLRGHRPRLAGVVDQDVDLAERLDDAVEGLRDVVGLRHVALERRDLAALRGRRDGSFGCASVRGCARGWPHWRRRRRTPSPWQGPVLSGAGDDGAAAVETVLPFSPSLGAVARGAQQTHSGVKERAPGLRPRLPPRGSASGLRQAPGAWNTSLGM